MSALKPHLKSRQIFDLRDLGRPRSQLASLQDYPVKWQAPHAKPKKKVVNLAKVNFGSTS